MRRHAQTTVEFALAVPLFLALLFAVVEFSRLLFTYVSLTNGAREMARVAVLTRSSNSSVVAGFNSYTTILGSTDPSTDRVTVTVADQACANDQRQGRTCTPLAANVTCTLPLQSTCPLPLRASAGGGYVQVDVTYRFHFAEVASLPGISVLTTSARAYVE